MPTRTKRVPLTPRKSAKQERSRQLVEDVLEGAIRVFDREGLEATTNRGAREAGVSVGSLYQYFPNKESLLLALAERHVQRTSAAVEAVLREHAEAAEVEDLVTGLVRAVLREHRKHTTLRPLLRRHGPEMPAIAQGFERCIADAQAGLVAVLQRSRPDVANPELRARVLVAAVDGLIHGELEIDDEVEEELVALSVRYFAG